MIRIENVTKYYGDVCAVDQVNLEINQGEIVGLLGPNGAGKTTTLRMLTGSLSPSHGDIRVRDWSVREQPLAIKKLIGYLPESAPLYPELLVYDFLRFVAGVRGIDAGGREARIRRIAEQCGLDEVMHKSIHELSKGYRQRVGLAHAMMGDPEILVLDEPTSGLDPNQIVEIRELIRELGKKKTVILSTHILSEAEAACDRVVIINKGRIAADGTAQDLKKETGGGYHVAVSLTNAEFEEVRGAFAEVPGVHDTVLHRAADGVLDVAVACATAEDCRPALYTVIRGHAWSLLEFRREERTLETIFRHLTREE